jgi:pyridoxal 5'-phosphate synthase pdxT subunit
VVGKIMIKIGVLALQGAVREHIRLLEQTGVRAIEVKTAAPFPDLDGLIIPGGESTTISKLMHAYELKEPIRQMHAAGKPIFGTCAGLILIAKRVEGLTEPHVGLLDVSVKRNAFGRQVDSFEASLHIAEVGDHFSAIFIRAPYIEQIGPGVKVLADVEGKIVAVRQATLLGAAFHPELTDDLRLHAYFVKMVRQSLLVK